MAFFTAFFVVVLATPSLIKVAKLKHLVDVPTGNRKKHKTSIPTIGGVIIFSAFIFACLLWFPDGQNTDKIISPFLKLLASLILMFFVGVKDDIIGTAPMKKMLALIVVGFIIVAMGGVKITSLHGLFGVDVEFPEYAQLLLSIFVFISIVNAINLIDGVDGLATGLGIIFSLFFVFWFYYSNQPHWTLVSVSLLGALVGFLIFNFHPARIFMGDSGSLTIGTILTVLTIQLIETPTTFLPDALSHVSTPILAMAVLAYPILDTLRVFITRLLKGKSPFEADRTHLHHKLQDKGYSSHKVILIIFMFNITMITTALLLPTHYGTLTFLTCTIIALAFIVFATYQKK
jgi:UDP-N-acetylmuramyl pentapeptide phosphotransferase/UDP-N-acetylglucosamine-1-phosphate transferase